MSKILYSSEHGDLRGKKNKQEEAIVNEKDICLYLRRLTSGKGRTIIEITNLPNNKSWCKNLAKEIKNLLASAVLIKIISLKFMVKKLMTLNKFWLKKIFNLNRPAGSSKGLFSFSFLKFCH